MIYIHNINPVALNIFNLNIYWYSLAYIFAFLVGGMYAKKILVIKDVSFKSIHVDEFISYSIILDITMIVCLIKNINNPFRRANTIIKAEK